VFVRWSADRDGSRPQFIDVQIPEAQMYIGEEFGHEYTHTYS